MGDGRLPALSGHTGSPGGAGLLLRTLRSVERITVVFEHWLGHLGRRKSLAVLLTASVSLVLCLGYWAANGYPAPMIPDEFCYLLAADTFASGRLANPTHPLWVYFESPHTIHQPTYVSAYPPAQGLVLAAGQRVAGHPWFGVLLSVVAMCAAVCWMLQGWLPPRWALLGGLLACCFTVFSYWATTYYGGAVAATGGALVLGGLPRIWKSCRARDAFLLAVGLSILANSRPYEGLVLGLAVAGLMLFWILRRNVRPARQLLRRVLFPIGATLAITAAGMAYYHWRTTGNPFRMPYQVALERHMIRRMFLWQSDRPEPVYRHKEMRDLYRALLREELSWWELAGGTARRLVLQFSGGVMIAALLLTPWVFRDRRFRPLLICLFVGFAGVAGSVYIQPHYAAPLTGALLALLVQCLRHLRTWRPGGWPLGRAAVLVLVLLSVGVMAGRWIWRSWLRIDFPPPWQFERERIENQLSRSGEKHLILVRYSQNHYPFFEWVYNRADIDTLPVVWAREMQDNTPLLEYFRSRRIWLLEADRRLPRLQPYPRGRGDTEVIR